MLFLLAFAQLELLDQFVPLFRRWRLQGAEPFMARLPFHVSELAAAKSEKTLKVFPSQREPDQLLSCAVEFDCCLTLPAERPLGFFRLCQLVMRRPGYFTRVITYPTWCGFAWALLPAAMIAISCFGLVPGVGVPGSPC